MEPVHNSLDKYLPAEMRLLPGIVGLVGGGALIGLFFYTIFVVHYSYHSVFTPSYSLAGLVVGLGGLCGALWYVILRPLVFRLTPALAERLTSFSPDFSRGMGLAVVGAVLPWVVNDGSGGSVQALGILGAVLLTVAPLWYWFVGAIEWPWRDYWPDDRPTPSGRQAVLAGGAVVVVLSVALTPVVALPMLSADETATNGGVAVTITDVQRTDSVVGARNDSVTAGPDTELVVVEFTIENRGSETWEPAPYFAYNDVVRLTSPACGTTFSPECRDVTPYAQNFTAGGMEYDYIYANGYVYPGETKTGAAVWEVPRRTDGGEGPRLTFTFLDIGRWNVSG